MVILYLPIFFHHKAQLVAGINICFKEEFVGNSLGIPWAQAQAFDGCAVEVGDNSYAIAASVNLAGRYQDLDVAAHRAGPAPSDVGIIAGMATRGAQYGAIFGGRGRDNNGGAPVWLVVLLVSMITYAISFFLTRLLSRYRELCADRSGAFLTGKPSALASALTKITGEIANIPTRDLRSAQSMNAFFIAPAISGISLKTLTSTHPSLEQRLEQLAKISAELGRPLDGGFPQPGQPL